MASLAERLVGPSHYRVIVTGEPIDDSFVDAVVEDVLSLCRFRPMAEASPPKKRHAPASNVKDHR
ncbi:hypothetical protein [Mycobacterium sp. E2497]|uniref:hypothetical protein n=1 Tax=Mycobacterium sp. E2497 TaxID=1834135 RepID=UPI000800FED9|nr:hypothetical protein A5713_06455 [Mycobacterium sp. E2497]